MNKFVLLVLFVCTFGAQAAEKLVLDLDFDSDLLSFSHNIDGLPLKATMNFSATRAGNINENFLADALKNHLAATVLVRIDGEIAGFATEQEVLVTDAVSGETVAESAWLITLNYPGASGFMAVSQHENSGPVLELINKVVQDPEGPWPDKFQRFLTSSNSPTVQLAVGDLAGYQGGQFEEYNSINPADLAKLKRFRAKVQFVIYPGLNN